MQYKVNGRIFKSENAAKPVLQKSKYLCAYLQSLDVVERSLDYGCGKLRYLNELRSISNELYLLDSDIQLMRRQKLFEQRTSIVDFISKYNSLKMIRIPEIYNMGGHFDRIFCFNVLSAIPIVEMRWRILANMRRMLRSGGEVIVVHQYRNSDFNRMKKMKNGMSFRDGFLVDSRRGPSFYADFSVEVLVGKLEDYGYSNLRVKRKNGSVYIKAS